MIISRARSYVFVHIPKTGGTAMALALEARAAADDILIGDTPKAVRRRGRIKGVITAGRLWKHSTLADIDGLVGVEELDRFLIFALVRNPWDRMVSYFHWLQTQSFDHPAVGLAKTLSFSGFLNDPAVGRSIATHPYGSYLVDRTGIERPAVFVRLEHLAEDLAPVCRHLGFVPDLPHTNASDRERDWRGFYSDADAALIGRLCAGDIARFGYRFDPPSAYPA